MGVPRPLSPAGPSSGERQPTSPYVRGPSTEIIAGVGPYVVKELLGEGGFGSVHRAVHVESGELVALKLLRSPRSFALEGLRREIQALSRLEHPGIARILDHGVARGVPWYAMEIVDGIGLLAAVQTREGAAGTPPQLHELSTFPMSGTLAPPGLPEPAVAGGDPAADETDIGRALALVVDLCDALRYLHGEGLVHRDLKPENVIVTPSGRTVVVDFGLTAPFQEEGRGDSLSVSGQTGGTAAYVAPEQARGELVDARADLYSLGCILYRLVAGCLPFEAPTPLALAWKHLHEEPVPPSRRRAGVPEALDALILRLLAKSPRARFGYADDVARALAACGAGVAAWRHERRAKTYLYRAGLAGRDAPLRRALAHLAAVGEGQGGMVLIGGESGVGKTRLALELLLRGRERGSAVSVASCLEGESGPLASLQLPLEQLADRCRDRGRGELVRLLGPGARIFADYAPGLAALPEMATLALPTPLEGDEAKARVWRALAGAFEALASERPQLLVIDDAQWADELTMGFLGFLARSGRLRRAPLGVVVTFRPEPERQELAALARSALRLDLERLDDGAVKSMAQDMLAVDDLPPLFAGFLASRSGGNPFFASEYLRLCVEQGLLARGDDGRFGLLHATEEALGALPVPASIESLVARRLEGLSTEATLLVELAAVIGREVDVDVLRAAARMDPGRARDAEQELVRRDVMVAADEGLRFAHDRIREVARDRLDAGARVLRHRAVAHALEREGIHDAARLARHWRGAGEPERARRLYLAAAREALARHAHEEAERRLRRHVELADGPSVEDAIALELLGREVLQLRGRIDEAVEVHLRAVALAEQLGARPLLVRALCSLGTARKLLGRMGEAESDFSRALEIARGLHDPSVEAHAISTQAALCKERGQLEAAWVLFSRAMAIHRDAGDRVGEAQALMRLGAISIERSLMEEAREIESRALALARAAGDRRLEGSALWSLGTVAMMQSRFEEARSRYEEALQVVRAVGDRVTEGAVLGNLSTLLQEEGRLHEALAVSEMALAIHRESASRRHEAAGLAELANIHFRSGREAEARRLMQESIVISREIGESRHLAIALGNLGVMLGEVSCRAEARASFEEALSIHRRMGNQRSVAIVLDGLALLEMDEGDLERAEDLLAEASSLARKVGNPRGVALTLEHLATLRRWQERYDEASACLDRAEESFLAIGAHFDLVPLVCGRGFVMLAQGRRADAELARARALLAEVGGGEASEAGQFVGRLARAVARRDRGEELCRGECPEDLEEPARRRLMAPAGSSRTASPK